MSDVTFFFDPVCPWTWRAARWLTGVAEARHLDVEWRPLSLLVVNDGPDEEHGAEMEASHRALRLVEHLHRAGRHGDVAGLYRALGELHHEGGAPLDDDLTAHAARSAGVADAAAVIDDDGLDAGIRASTETATKAAGPGVGSPVVILPGAGRGLHGPVLGAVPTKAAGLALWDAVEALAPIDEFFEMKRGRP